MIFCDQSVIKMSVTFFIKFRKLNVNSNLKVLKLLGALSVSLISDDDSCRIKVSNQFLIAYLIKIYLKLFRIYIQKRIINFTCMLHKLAKQIAFGAPCLIMGLLCIIRASKQNFPEPKIAINFF